MPTPFPGMDPYLERRDRWQAVHTRLIVAIADALGPQIRPRYRVDIELRTYVEIPMPEEIHERYLVVREVATEEVITIIEILSLANKLTHEGREAYEAKRAAVLGSKTHLIEIDLLRAGDPLSPFLPQQSDYRILISRFRTRPQAAAYPFSIRDPIPDIPVPLRPGDPEPTLPLNKLLHALYDRAGYDLVIDYGQPPSPPLNEADVAWVSRLFETQA